METKRIVKGIRTAVVGLLLLNLLSLPAYGQANDPMAIATFGLVSPRLLNALNLTPEQAARIQVIKNTFREANKAYLAEVIPLRTEVADKLFGPNRATEADVARQITKIADLREKILREGFRLALEVRQVLTPEQLAKAAAIRQQLLKIGSDVRSLYNEPQ